MYTKLLGLLDSEAPWTLTQNRKSFKKWISQETKLKITERDKVRESARTSKSEAQWKLYRTLRNECTSRVKKERVNFFEKNYTELEKSHDVRGTYEMMKNQAGWKISGPPRNFLINGKMDNSPIRMANAQLDYFNDKLSEIQNSLPRNNTDPMEILEDALAKWDKTATREVF